MVPELISESAQSIDQRSTAVPFVRLIVPVSVAELHPRLRRLLYHLLHRIRPE